MSPQEIETFWSEALHGLAASPKRVSPKYLYDERGSEIFERICETPEYYPTRTEIGILEAHAAEIAAAIGRDSTLYEFGSGSSRKIRLLLNRLESPRAYVPIDISGEFLGQAAASVASDYPGLRVVPLRADFTRPETISPLSDGPRAAFFPGSTIGNFDPQDAASFLRATARFLGRGGRLVVGVDLAVGPGKDVTKIEAAYNDSAGVTREFNLNLLARMNRELGADFDLSAFEHRAFFNSEKSRIEMHLESIREQTARVGTREFRFEAGETIHTECSYKYTPESFRSLALGSGFTVLAGWTGPEQLFAVFCLESVLNSSRDSLLRANQLDVRVAAA